MSHLYRVLGVGRRADSAQIKSAFRALAKTCHPDLHGGSATAERRFRDIWHAYETLANPTSRAAYDALERARARQRFRSVATTMAASFAITVGSGAFVAGWLLGA